MSYLDSHGRRLSLAQANSLCEGDGGSTMLTRSCFQDKHLRQRLVYHPARHLRRFQLTEVAILLAGAAELNVFVVRRTTRRLL